MDMSRNLIMIFKESLNNILKYSRAQHVTLDIHLKRRDTLQMVLRDDGVGFEPKNVKKGNGISNMQIRATRLNGRLYLDSRPGKGTIITLTFPVPKTK
jgi:signal transduction histidine kinase